MACDASYAIGINRDGRTRTDHPPQTRKEDEVTQQRTSGIRRTLNRVATIHGIYLALSSRKILMRTTTEGTTCGIARRCEPTQGRDRLHRSKNSHSLRAVLFASLAALCLLRIAFFALSMALCKSCQSAAVQSRASIGMPSRLNFTARRTTP
jgi:hypothetical protein